MATTNQVRCVPNAHVFENYNDSWMRNEQKTALASHVVLSRLIASLLSEPSNCRDGKTRT